MNCCLKNNFVLNCKGFYLKQNIKETIGRWSTPIAFDFFFTIVNFILYKHTYIFKFNFWVTFTNNMLANWCNVEHDYLNLVFYFYKNNMSTKDINV